MTKNWLFFRTCGNMMNRTIRSMYHQTSYNQVKRVRASCKFDKINCTPYKWHTDWLNNSVICFSIFIQMSIRIRFYCYLIHIGAICYRRFKDIIVNFISEALLMAKPRTVTVDQLNLKGWNNEIWPGEDNTDVRPHSVIIQQPSAR